MPVSHVRITSQINWSNVNAKIGDQWLLFSRIVCSGQKIPCKKYNDTFVIVSNDWGSRVRRFANSFHEWRCHKWTSLANRNTCNSCIILYLYGIGHVYVITAHVFLSNVINHTCRCSGITKGPLRLMYVWVNTPCDLMQMIVHGDALNFKFVSRFSMWSRYLR